MSEGRSDEDKIMRPNLNTHLEESSESFGIISNLNDTISDRSFPIVDTPKPILSPEETLSTKGIENAGGSGSSKSSNGSKASRKRKDLYGHVQSKVKLYRLEIQKQKGRKRKLDQDFQDEAHSEEKSIDKETLKEDTCLDQLKNCKVQIQEYQEQVKLLNKQAIDLMQENAALVIRMERLRLEAQRYKNMLDAYQESKNDTPMSKRSNRNSQISLLKTPIRILSRTLLSPYRNTNKSNTPATTTSTSESESGSDNCEAEGPSCYKTFSVEGSMLPIHDIGSSASRTSDVPLIKHSEDNSANASFSTRAKAIFMNIFSCPKATSSTNIRRHKANKQTMKKIRCNKVHPLDETSAIHTPTSGKQGMIGLSRDKDKLKIPIITISTPTSSSTYIVENARKMSKKRVTYSSNTMKASELQLTSERIQLVENKTPVL